MKYDLSKSDDLRGLLIAIGGDDWSSLARGAASFVLPHLWKWAKNTNRGQQIIKGLRDYAGIDLNDDQSYLGNHFAVDVSQRKNM